MERAQRTRLASLGILALVFASGGVVGMAVDRTTGADVSAAEAGERQEEEAPRDGRRRPRMYEQVGLSPEERRIADSVVAQHREAYRALNRKFRRDADSIVAASGRERAFREDADSLVSVLRGRLRSLMTAEQIAKYDSLVVENDRRSAERERRSGDRGN